MIAYQRDADGIVTLTIDMPDRAQNVWNQASLDALSETITRLAADAGAHSER